MKLLLLFVSLFVPAMVVAETGFQFAVPNLNAPSDPHVSGLRLSFLHGENRSMNGLDFGLLSLSETDQMSGVGFIAGVHKVDQRMSGGVAFSLMNYHLGSDSGMNAAFINLLNDSRGAFNLGFVTIAKGSTMVDLGGVNVSKRSGAQIGFINVTNQIDTFQFGFLNMAKNGFLPIFPVFNFPVD